MEKAKTDFLSCLKENDEPLRHSANSDAEELRTIAKRFQASLTELKTIVTKNQLSEEWEKQAQAAEANWESEIMGNMAVNMAMNTYILSFFFPL